tara:strand:+ start:5444 stop:5605 length:162 start_codon:yes stop_codon:yes gene_type:complete
MSEFEKYGEPISEEFISPITESFTPFHPPQVPEAIKAPEPPQPEPPQEGDQQE